MNSLWNMFKARIAVWFCKHSFYRMKHHGLLGEPFFMCCERCGVIRKLDYLQTDRSE